MTPPRGLQRLVDFQQDHPGPRFVGRVGRLRHQVLGLFGRLLGSQQISAIQGACASAISRSASALLAATSPPLGPPSVSGNRRGPRRPCPPAFHGARRSTRRRYHPAIAACGGDLRHDLLWSTIELPEIGPQVLGLLCQPLRHRTHRTPAIRWLDPSGTARSRVCTRPHRSPRELLWRMSVPWQSRRRSCLANRH